MPENVPHGLEADAVRGTRPLRDFLIVFAAAVFLGYAIALVNDPFIFVMYIQLLFLLIAILIVSAPALIFVHHRPARAHPPGDQSSKMAAVESLPYLSRVDHVEERADGVIDYDPALSTPGLNLYNSYYGPGAYLLDMAGNTLHTWRPRGAQSNWQYVTARGNGDLLVCVEDEKLMRLGWDSRILWQLKARTHREIAVAENQDIYTLTSREEVVLIDLVPVPIINDYIVVLSPGGAVKKQISLFSLLRDELSSLNVIAIYSRLINPRDLFWKGIKSRLSHHFLLPRVTSFDPFHTNTITIINRDIRGVCRKGDVLVSMRSLNLIGIVDLEREKLVWTWGPGELQEQHEPTLLDNGNLMIFDNGTRRKYSRLIELDPLAKKIVWEYHDSGSAPFYSGWGGAAQRLQNGNTLVTETSGGRVFEITREGRTVWDFYNPDRQDDGRRVPIYRLTRITDPHLESVTAGNIEESGEETVPAQRP